MTTLFVPVHVDCLYLARSDVIVEAMADFARQPFAGKTRDANPDVANVTEDILSQPFESKNLLLKPGVHLHWALPDALTKGRQSRARARAIVENGSIREIVVVDGGAGYVAPPVVSIAGASSVPAKAAAILKETEDKGAVVEKIVVVASGAGFTETPEIVVAASQRMEFPPVPDRWLVSRTYSGKGDVAFPLLKQWVVESNYLYPTDTLLCGSVTYPTEVPAGEPPFRYLGRQVPLEAWLQLEPSTSYLERLTAVGYGESAFAAFYPNCHSVFGFHDEDAAQIPPAGLKEFRYNLIGWFSRPAHDPIQALLAALDDVDEKAKVEAIEGQLKWRLGSERPTNAPDRTVCYARLNLAPDADSAFTAGVAEDKSANTRIAVGNTGTEALSALLAASIDPENKADFEDQLEALHMGGRLDGMRLDVGPKFKEARHERGFQARAGGMRWSIRQSSPPGQAADARTGDLFNQLTLDEALGETLNELNRLQHLYDRALGEIESSQSQLYADWYKYMLCAYPLEDAHNDAIDIDEVKYFIETRALPALAKKRRMVGKLLLRANEEGSVIEATDAGGGERSLAKQVAAAVGQVAETVGAHNDALSIIGVDDVADWLELVSVLPDAPGANGAAGILQRLRQGAGDIATKIDAKKGPDASQKAILVDVINRLIDDASLYEAFNAETASDTIKSLLLKPAPTRTLRESRRLNRLIVEAALPGILHSGPRNEWVLKAVPAPRFWQPRPPVVLMTGSALEATKRHASDGKLRADGLLQCFVGNADRLGQRDAAAFVPALTQLDEIAGGQGDEQVGIATWTGSSWHPFLLEWEVEVFPLRDGCNHAADDQKYSTDFITRNFAMEENQQDPTVRPGHHKVMGAANLYSGRTVLTPLAEMQLKNEIEAFLKQRMLSDYAASLAKDAKASRPSDAALLRMILGGWDSSLSIPKDVDIDREFAAHVEKLIPWYAAQTWRAASRAVTNIIAAYAFIQSETFYSLSQALGGFDDALLMHRQVLQLPIADPLAFDDYAAFTEDVRREVESSTRRAPEPANSFNPIRTGHLRILRLRLIDTFGRTIDVVENVAHNPITPDSMKVAWDPDAVYLPPRLVQPARLNVRWLSAEHDEKEMNDHPATTPICGWLLPNNLDGTLMVYDAKGGALGYIDQETRWRPPPGRDALTFAPALPVSKRFIPNDHLRHVVNKIRRQGETFLGEFLTTVESALENIDPEGFAQHQALALLIGRPIAVVRVSLDLEVQGHFAEDQSWRSFRSRLGGNLDQTAAYPDVRFPVRIGEYRQLNDGVVGYWNERDEGDDAIFYVNDSDKEAVLKSRIVRIADAPTNIELSLSAPPENLTVLMDPRGKLHASIGILPTKVVDIPADQYADALAAINVTFFSAPILTDVDKLRLPLPSERGFAWSWIEKRADIWRETPRSDIAPPVTEATFMARQAIREGWLKLAPSADAEEPSGDDEQETVE